MSKKNLLNDDLVADEDNLLSDDAKPTHADLIPPDIARTMSYAYKLKGLLKKGAEVLSDDSTDRRRAEHRKEIEALLKELETPETLKPSIDGNMLILASRKVSIGLDALGIAALSLQKDLDIMIRLLKKEDISEASQSESSQSESQNKK